MGSNDVEGRNVADPQEDQEGREVERGAGTNGRRPRTSDKTIPDTEALITSEEEGILPRQTIQRLQRR